MPVKFGDSVETANHEQVLVFSGGGGTAVHSPGLCWATGDVV